VNGFTAEEKVAETFVTGPAPRVVVEMFNGTIEVTTQSATQVKAEVTKRCTGSTEEAAKENLEKIEVKMSQEGDTLRITARLRDRQAFNNAGASAVVYVPAGASLELHSSNGKVGVTGVTGSQTISTSNGPIQVKGSKGQLGLTTSNGPITVDGGTGPIQLESSNSPIALTAENAVVTAQTSNGGIRFQGSLAEGKHAFESSNGSISLTLPPEAHFHLDAATSNGSITSAFALTEGGRSGKSHLRGSVGTNPTMSLKLETSNGSITLHKGS
jgi:DUF4097 and DUF4098 domain-containing protein YvlB